MRRLSHGVHAGVGTAAAVHAHPLPRKTFYRVFQTFLHRIQPLLFLPAVVRRPDIIDKQPYYHTNHQSDVSDVIN